MDFMNWLNELDPDFPNLIDDEAQVFAEFLFLWSLFEAKALKNNKETILESSVRWADHCRLTAQTFGTELTYFRDRYVSDGELNDRFGYLNFSNRDKKELVREVLIGNSKEPSNCAAAVLFIVYRYRNNLFHGLKSPYDYRGQLVNFKHANSALKQAIELHIEGGGTIA